MAKGEPEVVRGEQLSRILKRWASNYLAERDGNRERVVESGAGSREMIMQPWIWLEQETGINERRIRGFIKGEYPYVGLSQADAVLQAAGFEGWLYSVVNVIPNPKWSIVDWVNYMSNRGCV